MKFFVMIMGVFLGIGFDCVRLLFEWGYWVIGMLCSQEDAQCLCGELGEDFLSLLLDVAWFEGFVEVHCQVQVWVGDQGLVVLVNNVGIVLFCGLLLLQLLEEVWGIHIVTGKQIGRAHV